MLLVGRTDYTRGSAKYVIHAGGWYDILALMKGASSLTFM